MAVPANAKVANVLNEPGVPITLSDGSVAYARMSVMTDASGNPIGGGTDAQQVQGNTAHDAAYSTSNPVGMGAYATSSFQAAVATGDMVRLAATPYGNMLVSFGAGSTVPGVDGTTLLNIMQAAGGSSGPIAAQSFSYNGTNMVADRVPALNARLLSSAATTNGTSVKASAGFVFRIQGNNTVASKRYLKLYNKASAPTVGTDIPVMTVVLLASAAFDFPVAKGYYFPLGIAFAITAGIADADTAAIGAGDIEAFNMMYA